MNIFYFSTSVILIFSQSRIILLILFFSRLKKIKFMSSRRQQKVAGLISESLNEIFQKHGISYYSNAFVTITEVTLSPDLLVAKVYVSIYNVPDKQKSLNDLVSNTNEIRKHLGNQLRFHLRRIPELLFFLDESIENAIRINELLKDIKKEQ